MVNIIKQEIEMETALKNKIEFICSFCNTTLTIHNGSIRTIEHTNISYVEPHRVIINGITYLAFNYETNIYDEGYIDWKFVKFDIDGVGYVRFSNYLPQDKVYEHIMRFREYYDVHYYEGILVF